MKILVVEDDLSDRTVLMEMLSPYGNVEFSVDGEVALQAFSVACEKKQPYDLICLDIMMPRVDGQGVLRRIREMEKEQGVKKDAAVKILMVTSLSDRTNVLKALETHCDGYILKPVHKEKLVQELQRLGLSET